MPLNLPGIIDRINANGPPRIEFVKRGPVGSRLGVFASSFNPPTVAHVQLVRGAAETFALDEVLALAGKANADKLDYECSLEDRLTMLTLAFAPDPNVSIGLSSHAFYVDMIDALQRDYPEQTDLHFIVGFDTFERVLDAEDRYTGRYYRKFGGRGEALEYLFAHSRLIVAGRAGAGQESVRLLVEREPAVPIDRVFYLDLAADLGELSATEARTRRLEGQSINEIVPATVADYIRERGFYSTQQG